MLSVIGFAVIASISTLLILGRIAPVVGLTTIPLVGALVAGFSWDEIGEFFESGIGSVTEVAVMLVFAILFFGVMNDIGLFNPLVNAAVRLTRGNVVAVCVGTVIVAAVCHLDGAGATTFLICIPAFLPVYKRLGMSPYLLLLLCGTSMGILNMLPWGGPVGRTAAVTGMDPVELWQGLIPVQVVSLVLVIGMAVLLGLREKRRIAAKQRAARPAALVDSRDAGGTNPPPHGRPDGDSTEEEAAGEAPASQRPHLPWLNVALVIGVVAVLVTELLPAGLTFMVALSVALVVNFPRVADQMERIKAHSGAALSTGAIILAAGSFLGILEGSGMLDSLATDTVSVLPESVAASVHLIMGVLGLPLELLLSTDAHYFALLPVVEGVAAQYGVSTINVVYPVLIGNIIGTFISPFTASVWLGVGLAGADMGKHIRYSFLPMWAFSLVVLACSYALGVITI